MYIKIVTHITFAPLDYGYSGVYLQKCKVTGIPTFAHCIELLP